MALTAPHCTLSCLSPNHLSYLHDRSTFLIERPSRAAHSLVQERNIKSYFSPVFRPTDCAATHSNPSVEDLVSLVCPYLLYESLGRKFCLRHWLPHLMPPIVLPENRGNVSLEPSRPGGWVTKSPESPWLCHLFLAFLQVTHRQTPVCL